MSLQVVYSFDHIQTADIVALPKIVSAVNCTISTGGRDATNCVRCVGLSSDGLVIALDVPDNSVTIGAWVTVESTGDSFVGLGNSNNGIVNNPHGCHTTLRAGAGGVITVWNKISQLGTLLGSTAGGVFQIGVPFYLEWQSNIGTTGSTIVKINEVEVLHLNTVNNMVGADDNVRTVVFGMAQATLKFDDIYVLTAEDTGDGWTDFKGIIKVNAKIVNGVGDVTQWAPSSPTGVNWQNVDESVPSVVDFNDAASVGLIDVYQLEDTVTDPIAVQVDLYAKKLDAGASSIVHVARISGANHFSADINALAPTFKYYKKVYTKQPGGSPWTAAVFNALQVGPQRVV